MWQVKATREFWETVRPFKEKYPEREYLARSCAAMKKLAGA